MRIRREERPRPGTRTGLDLKLIASCPLCQAWLAIEEGAAAATCADCNERYLLARRRFPFAAVVAPLIDALEARRQARGFLRSGAHRATQVGDGRWLLLPYWRYRAKTFQWIAGRRHSLPGSSADEFRDLRVQSFDLLIPASTASLSPDDLPPRPGILTAYPLTAQVATGAQVEPVTVDSELARNFALAEVEGRSVPRNTPVVRRRMSFVGEELLLVYLPFFCLDYRFRDEAREVIVDGVLGEVIAHRDASPAPTTRSEPSVDRMPAGAQPETAPESPGGRSTGLFLPRLCPGCSDDLDLEPDVTVHHCTSCGKAWEVTGEALREVKTLVADTKAAGPGSTYLPFWRLEVITRGVGPLAGIPPTPASPDGIDQFLTVYVPAFEARQVERLSHLGVHLTKAHPGYETAAPGTEILDRRQAAESGLVIPGVTLSREDAARLAWVFVGSLASTDAKTFARLLDTGRVETATSTLLWLPFRQSGLYLREPVSGALIRALPGLGQPGPAGEAEGSDPSDTVDENRPAA